MDPQAEDANVFMEPSCIELKKKRKLNAAETAERLRKGAANEVRIAEDPIKADASTTNNESSDSSQASRAWQSPAQVNPNLKEPNSLTRETKDSPVG